MLNRVILQGRIGNDPEIRTTPSGTEVCNVRLAVESDYKNQNGERAVDWINVTAWKEKATFLSRYGSKGRMLIVEGQLRTQSSVDKNGNKRYETFVNASQLYFADSKKDDTAVQQAAQAPAQSYVPQDYLQQPAPKFEDISDDEELPFN